MELKTPEDEIKKRVIGTHQNAELGRFVSSDKKGELWLDAGVYQTRLGLLVRKDQSRHLVFKDVPLMGLSLEILDSGPSLRMKKAQESQDFEKVN